MLISHSRKFVFVHVYKAAGTSVTQALLPHARWVDRAVYGRGRLKRAIQLFNRITGQQHKGHRHITGHHKFATARQIRDRLGAERFDSYFSFGFVRNPFDWFVSIHAHLRRLQEHPLHGRASGMEFGDFLAWSVEQRTPRQSDFVTAEDGSLLVDFVGRVETLEADLRQIRARLRLPEGNAPHENASPGREKDYRRYYDDRSRGLVEQYFAEDLARFGYGFEGLCGDRTE